MVILRSQYEILFNVIKIIIIYIIFQLHNHIQPHRKQ